MPDRNWRSIKATERRNEARMALADEAPPPPESGNIEAPDCPSDEDLLAFALGRLDDTRVAEVHIHLDECETCQRVLSEAAHALATAATSPLREQEEDGWVRTFQPGTLVARRYLIQHFIARGGMGEVYEAFDRDMQQKIALKTVTSTAGDNPRAVKRLKGEVQLARRVSHPNVCRIHDLGTHVTQPSGAQIHFLTMEFVEGETLGQRVRLAGALPLDEVKKVARELVLGLGAAHEAGILHRDFKSDNVILKGDAEGQSTAVILDFGLARALDQESDQPSSSNPTLVGTFGYIAPEQLEGKPHTPASDVYAFGVVLFEMLTGQLPFESGSSPAVNALERLHKRAPAPSSVNPDVPNTFDALVARCLCRAPEERFQSAREVLTALDAAVQSTHAGPPRPRFDRRIAALALVAAALAVPFYFAIQSSRAPERAPAPRPIMSTASPERGLDADKLAPAETPTAVSPQPALEPAPGGTRPRPLATAGSDTTTPSSERALTKRLSAPNVASPSASAAVGKAAESAAAPASATPSAAPGSTPERPADGKKPDWENPFGAMDRSGVVAGDAPSAT
jgi:serine/threonine protein kinase